MSLDEVAVTPLTRTHWPEVREIYARGIATGNATFDDQPPTWEQFQAGKLAEHRLVAVAGNGRTLGWVAASRVSGRCVYSGVVEHSVYVHPAAGGRGVGRLLLEALVASTETAGIWTIECGVFPENTASLVLHHRAGFRELGVRRRLGQMTHGPHAGQWRDVILLERRSATVGIDPQQ